MTEYRSEANDRRNRTILQAILSRRLPKSKAGDRQRHELTKAAEERAGKAEAGVILRNIASAVAGVKTLEHRREKLLRFLDWALSHEAGKVVHEELCDCKRDLELKNTAQIEEWLYQTLIGKKPYGQYPTKPDAEDVGEPGAEDETDSYKYPGKPRIITKRDSYPPVGDNASIEDLINTIRDFLSNHPQLTLDDIYRSAKVAV